MAGDWIPITCDIHAKPETVRIAAALRRSTDEVVGMLVRFWSWAQSQSSDGTLEGIDIAMAAAACHVSTKFLAALVSVGWLAQADHGLVIPRFDRWMGNAAKSRLQAAFRQRKQRLRMRRLAEEEDVTSASRQRHGTVTQLSRCERDKSVTIEENRTEEKSINNLSPNGDSPHDERADPRDRDPRGCSSHCSASLRSAISILTERWNAIDGVVKVHEWTEKRRNQLRTRLRDPTWLDKALEAISRIPECPFLLGDNDRGWRADMEWFLRPDSVAKVLEGKYLRASATKQSIFGVEV
jgi:hypothetical protein